MKNYIAFSIFLAIQSFAFGQRFPLDFVLDSDCNFSGDTYNCSNAEPSVVCDSKGKMFGFADAGDWYAVSLTDPSDITLVYPGQQRFFCGTSVTGIPHGAYYGIDSNNLPRLTQWVSMNPETGKRSVKASFAGNAPMIVDMTWNRTDNTVYCVGVDDGYANNSSLYAMNPETAEIRKIRDFKEQMYCLAADGTGKMFGVTAQGDLFIFHSPATGDYSRLCHLNVAGARYVSSMTMDEDSYMLKWAMTAADGLTYLIEINPLNGECRNCGIVGSKSSSKELSALTVFPSAPSAESPSAVEGLNCSVQSISTECILNWTNPTTLSNGNNINGIFGIDIEVNGLKTDEINGCNPGISLQRKLTNLPKGFVHLRVTPHNESGKGQYSDALVWIGNDLPSAPVDITTYQLEDRTLKTTWKMPKRGIHGGYVDTSKLKYRIERISAKGDTTVVAKVHRSTEFSDTTLKTPGIFIYRIHSLTTDYGESGIGPVIIGGPALTTPYQCVFDDLTSSRLWTRHDLNKDGNCWNESFMFHTVSNGINSTTGADDWLVSYPIHLTGGKEYYLYFEFKTYQGELYNKTLEATIGDSPDFTQHKTVAIHRWADREIHQARHTVRIDSTGDYYIGLHDCTDHRAGATLYLTNVNLLEKETGYITGTITDTEGEPVGGADVGIEGTNVRSETDEKGMYCLDYVPQGSFPITVYAYGYGDAHSIVNTDWLQTVKQDFKLTPLERHTLSGALSTKEGNAVCNARIRIEGYGEPKELFTDGNGRYRIEELPYHPLHKYYIKIRKPKYEAAIDSLILDRDMTLDYSLIPAYNPPANPNAEIEGNEIRLTWDQPRDIYRYDNGVTGSSQSGTTTPNDYAVYGSSFHDPCVIRAVKWMTTEYRGPHKEMNIWIFSIDSRGVPTDSIMFYAMHVPAEGDLVWNKYELPQPVNAPNGCFVGVSYSPGMCSLAWDTGKDPDWPFHPWVNFENQDFRTKHWILRNESYDRKHRMLRLEYDDIDHGDFGFEYSYRIWRMNESDRNNRQAWICVSENTQINEFRESRDAITSGKQQYAIETIYPGNVMSEPVFSQVFDAESSFAGSVLSENNAVRVEIYSPTGIKILSLTGEGVRTFDYGTLSPGIYLIKSVTGNKTTTQRIIIK